jgi:hypothetical protein
MLKAAYNSLPARPEHLKAVTQALSEEHARSLALIIRLAKLTRTQTLCALEKLLQLGLVDYDAGKKTYLKRPLGELR